MNPHEDQLHHERAAREDGFLRRIMLPEGWTLFRVPEDPPQTWDDAAEDREMGRRIRVDDPPRDPDEFVKHWPLPARSAESKYIPSGG